MTRAAMRVRLGALVLAIASLSGAVLAQSAAPVGPPPTREQVMKLVSLMGLQKKVDAVLRERQSKVRAGAHGCFLDMNPGADQATIERLDAALAATPQVTYADLADDLVASAQRRLSAADVETAIAFYGSEAGLRLQREMPEILREANVHSAQLVKQKLQAYSDSLNKTLMDFQNEMNQQKPHSPSGGKKVDPSQTTHTGTI